MKKIVILLTALAMIAGFSTATFAASIVGSAHDLSDDGLGTDEICVFCHVPHNPSSTEAPLWNHAVTTQTFTLYDGSTSTATGISSLCLSCHDGVTNLDAFGGAAGTTDIDTLFTATTANIGVDLQDDHPVMMAYPSDWSTTGLFNDPSGLTSAAVYGGSNTVECASCHNPHDQTGFGGSFLRASNSASALCRDCHNK